LRQAARQGVGGRVWRNGEWPPPCQRNEVIVGCTAQLQPVGEQLGGVAARTMDGATLQIADEAGTDTRPLR
jgi:hypothetical protein